MIYDILQDRDGFMWFATNDCLNRFDGYRFEVFTNDPFDPFSIAGYEVVSLLEDKQGNIWKLPRAASIFTSAQPERLDENERHCRAHRCGPAGLPLSRQQQRRYFPVQ